MKPVIKIFDTLDDLSGFFTEELASRISEIPHGQNFSWVLSGGRTPAVIFRRVSAGLKDRIDWKRIKVFWGDERCVAPDDRESNYRMARENLLDHLPIPGSNIFRIQGETDPVQEAARYSGIWRMHGSRSDGSIRPDLVMLGLGEDGHTASIFPGQTDIFNTEELYMVTEHPLTGQKRITATGTLINSAKSVIMLATGNRKAHMAAKVINQLDSWDQLPAALVRPGDGELIWLLDRPAGVLLGQKENNGE